MPRRQSIFNKLISRNGQLGSNSSRASAERSAWFRKTGPGSRFHKYILITCWVVFTLILEASGVNVSAMQIDVPLDQALVLAGGESTNPREYDPATTHTSGDKLVFSGLVSFDPSLNLVPDLAESWEISEDGTIYKFHLRKNARFHDGKPVTAQDVIYSWERAASPALGS